MVRVAILHVQKTDNVEMLGNAASRECSCEEDNVTEEVNSATGNWGIAEGMLVAANYNLLLWIWQRHGYGWC